MKKITREYMKGLRNLSMNEHNVIKSFMVEDGNMDKNVGELFMYDRSKLTKNDGLLRWYGVHQIVGVQKNWRGKKCYRAVTVSYLPPSAGTMRKHGFSLAKVAGFDPTKAVYDYNDTFGHVVDRDMVGDFVELVEETV